MCRLRTKGVRAESERGPCSLIELCLGLREQYLGCPTIVVEQLALFQEPGAILELLADRFQFSQGLSSLVERVPEFGARTLPTPKSVGFVPRRFLLGGPRQQVW